MSFPLPPIYDNLWEEYTLFRRRDLMPYLPGLNCILVRRVDRDVDVDVDGMKPTAMGTT